FSGLNWAGEGKPDRLRLARRIENRQDARFVGNTAYAVTVKEGNLSLEAINKDIITHFSFAEPFSVRFRYPELCTSAEMGRCIITAMKKSDIFVATLVAHASRKSWCHGPRRDPNAYSKRGKFLASSFREAEFWGRPLDEPHRLMVSTPLIGDKETIEKGLFGRSVSSEDIAMEERWKLHAKMRRAALKKANDSI